MIFNNQLKYFFIFVLSLLLACKSMVQQQTKINQRPISTALLFNHIEDQKIVWGSRAYIPLIAVGPVDFKLRSTLQSIKIEQLGNQKMLVVDIPDRGNDVYKVNLVLTTTNDSVEYSFKIHTYPPSSQIYFDPINGAIENESTKSEPADILSSMLSSLKENGPSTLYLKSGNYKKLELAMKLDFPIEIVAMAGHKVRIEQLNIKGQSDIKIAGIDFTGIYHNEHLRSREAFVNIDTLSSGIAIENCLFYAIDNSTSWKINDWYEYCINGIVVKGKNNLIANNLFFNTNFSIEINGDNNNISFNVIDRFEGDAIRNTGDSNIYDYNWISNATVHNYSDADGNHDDAFQAWTFDKPIREITIRKNQIFNCTEKDLPLKTGVLQGIVCFDGFVHDWLIEDNLVVIDHPHGIALYGAKNCMIKGNKVLKNPFNLTQWESLPWIRIDFTKDKRSGSDNAVISNIASAIELIDSTGVSASNNTIIKSMDELLDYNKWDFRLK